jgi:hypothetical protein
MLHAKGPYARMTFVMLSRERLWARRLLCLVGQHYSPRRLECQEARIEAVVE